MSTKTFLTILISFAVALSAVSVSAQTTALEQFIQKRQEAEQMTQQKRLELKSAIEAKRTELRDKIKAKKEELKTQLQKIKDERKKQIVERIDARIDTLNERMTGHYLKVLEQIEDVLGRVATRADKAAANGADITAVKAAIAKAQTTIASARAAATAQAGKTYQIAVTVDNNLRVDVGKARQALRTDLVSVREAVKAAHMAVRDAAVSLAKIPRVNEAGVPANGQPATTTSTTTQSQ